jgi:hypothetical protein
VRESDVSTAMPDEEEHCLELMCLRHEAITRENVENGAYNGA